MVRPNKFRETPPRRGLQGFFTSGYFLEDVEMDAPNILRTAERKKILSNIESLGLLSAAEKAGLSLSKVLPSIYLPACAHPAANSTSTAALTVVSPTLAFCRHVHVGTAPGLLAWPVSSIGRWQKAVRARQWVHCAAGEPEAAVHGGAAGPAEHARAAAGVGPGRHIFALAAAPRCLPGCAAGLSALARMGGLSAYTES